MNAVAQYINNISETVSTVFEGLTVTFSHLVRRPITVQYPDRLAKQVQDTLPLRYRGILELDLDICTGCLGCIRACPISCIAIDIEIVVEDEDDEGRPVLGGLRRVVHRGGFVIHRMHGDEDLAVGRAAAVRHLELEAVLPMEVQLRHIKTRAPLARDFTVLGTANHLENESSFGVFRWQWEQNLEGDVFVRLD